MIYVTADPHIGHKAPFIYDQRGFSSPEEHDATMLALINGVVGSKDTLWILGDICWSDPVPFLSAIACKHINLIKGNHDRHLWSPNTASKLPPSVKLHENQIVEASFDGHPITMCHYPMVSWNKSHYNAWLLHGHLHHKEIPLKGKMLDVSPKKEHLRPYSFEEIQAIMKDLPDNWDFVRKEKSNE